MSDEAVVRVVLVDSTSGANTQATQSAASNLTSSSTSGINSDRLYREITKLSTDITKSFSTSLLPVVTALNDIYDVLNRDYDYSEKDYRETIEQTSALKFIGAILSGSEGAIGREVTKGIGTQSSDTQIISALKGIDANTRELRQVLSPDGQRKNLDRLSTVITGSLLGLGLNKLPAIWETQVALIDNIIKNIPTGGQIANVAMGAPSTIASMISDIDPSLISMGIGAIAAGLLLAFNPTEETKELSTNELLQAIGAKIEEQTVYTQSIATVNNVTDGRVEQIVSLLTPQSSGINANANADMLAKMEQPLDAVMLTAEEKQRLTANTVLERPFTETLPDYPEPIPSRHSEVIAPEDDIENEIIRGLEEDLANWPEPGVPDTKVDYPQAEEIIPEPPKLSEPPVPDTKVYNPWDDYVRKARPGVPLTREQREELASVGLTSLVLPNGGNIIGGNIDLDDIMTLWRTRSPNPPEYFASGGSVGTDTIPAMLSPGEVVVPKGMVDAGAVDHLKGKLPGFSNGGYVNHYAKGGQVSSVIGAYTNIFTTRLGDTDPSERLQNFGSGVAAFGAKLTAAVPPLGMFIEGVGATTKAVGTLVGAINSTVDQYAEYSPEIAQAQAMVEITQTMGDMRRSQEISTDMTKFVVAQGELQQRYEEVKIKLLSGILPPINKILGVIDKIMGNGQGLEAAISLLLAPLTLAAAAAEKIANLKEEERVPDVEDPTNQLLNMDIFDTSKKGGGGSVPMY